MTRSVEDSRVTDRDGEARATRLGVADVVGTLMEFWGFKRPMGRMWLLLYLSPQAMSAAEIGQELQMSTGAVSTTLTDLSKWGVIRRSWVPGDRRDFFEAETSVWKLVSRVVREREFTMVREAKESFAAADRKLQELSHGASLDEKRRRSFERERVGQLRSLAETGETLLSALVAGEAISAAPLALFGAARALSHDLLSTRRRRR